MHSGQEVYTEEDLFINGHDDTTDIRILRRYTSRGIDGDEAFGPGWSLNYYQTIKWLDGAPAGSYEITGFGRRDSFIARVPSDPLNVWYDGTGGRADILLRNTIQDTVTVRRRNGSKWVFAHPNDGMGGETGYLKQVISANGNTLTIDHDASNRISTITDSFGRVITFGYDPQNTTDPRIHSITDFEGRVVSYSYVNGYLRTKTSPATTGFTVGTETFNAWPNGVTTRYTYDATPGFEGYLTGVIAPNEAMGSGHTYLSWTYEHQASSDTTGWVKTHTVGNTNTGSSDLNAGGTYRYSYTVLSTDPNASRNTAVMRTRVEDRRIHYTNLEFNRFGQLLTESVETAGLRANEPSKYTTTYRYSDDGLLESQTNPLNDKKEFAYSSDSSVVHGATASQTSKKLIPDNVRSHVQAEIEYQTVFEPVYNKPFKVYDPRGLQPGNDPEDYATVYVYDYMEDLSLHAQALSNSLGITTLELQTLWSNAGIASYGEVNGDGDQTQRCGNVVAVLHPDVELPPQAAAQVGMPATQSAQELFVYNEFGQLTRHIDAEENVTVYFYNPQSDPDGDGQDLIAGANQVTGGYLSLVGEDVVFGTTSPNRNNGAGYAPLARVQTIEYLAQPFGVPGNQRGWATAVIDGRGIETVWHVNEIDQLVRRIEAADAPMQTPQMHDLTAYAYETIYAFDANGNLVRVLKDNRDRIVFHTSTEPDYVEWKFAYDILNHIREKVVDAGALASGDPYNDEIVDKFSYDASENITSQVEGFGTTEQSETRWEYDERNLFLSVTHGYGAAELSTVSTEVDENGAFTAVVDAEGADRTEFIYDGFNRMIEVVERDGTQLLYEHDSDSNVTEYRVVGDINTFSTGTTVVTYADKVLYREVYHYDKRGRNHQVDTLVSDYGLGSGSIMTGSHGTVDATVDVSLFDRLGRSVFTMDTEGDVYQGIFDGLGRMREYADPEGNRVVREYDLEDNILKWTSRETSSEFLSPSSFDEFVYEARYDALHRLETFVEPNGQTTKWVHDSHNNVVRTEDELGNHVEFEFDRIGRERQKRQYLSNSGEDASAVQSSGIVTTKMRYDALHRLIEQEDNNGNVTEFHFDDLSRNIQTKYADNTSIFRRFNEDNELELVIDQAGSGIFITNDAMGRPTNETIIPASGSVVSGTSQRAWAYDGLGRVWGTFGDNTNHPNSNVGIDFYWDSLGRVVEETQKLSGHANRTAKNQFEGHKRLVALTYPDGRVVSREYDGLDRWVRIEESGGALIAEKAYAGELRLAKLLYGNGTELNNVGASNGMLTTVHNGTNTAGYDTNARPVQWRWKHTTNGWKFPEYRNTYNESVNNQGSGVGTNRRVREYRDHFIEGPNLERWDFYRFDSMYRMKAFVRDIGGAGGLPASASIFTHDGVDKASGLELDGLVISPLTSGGGLNQYTEVQNARTYDPNGSLTSDGTGRQFVFDALTRLKTIKEGGGQREHRYLYDAHGRRVAKIEVDGVTEIGRTRYLYAGEWKVVEERDGNGDLIRQYVDGFGMDDHIQMRVRTHDGMGGHFDEDYYYHCNSQGFVGGLSNSGGEPVEFYEYGMLGKPRFWSVDVSSGVQQINGETESLVGNEYLFQGRRYDKESGFYGFRYRYYDPQIGEYLSIDPSGLWRHGQGNGYSAFDADYWNMWDGWGLEPQSGRPTQLPHGGGGPVWFGWSKVKGPGGTRSVPNAKPPAKPKPQTGHQKVQQQQKKRRSEAKGNKARQDNINKRKAQGKTPEPRKPRRSTPLRVTDCKGPKFLKGLRKDGFRLYGPAKDGGIILKNPLGVEIRIHSRPPVTGPRQVMDNPSKYFSSHYYRIRPHGSAQWSDPVAIRD